MSMRRMYCFLIAILNLMSVIAVGQTSSVQQSCDNFSISIVRIEMPGSDWPLDFVKKSQILQRSPFDAKSDGEKGMVSTTYAVSEKPILLPYITVNGCDKTAVVSSFVFKPDGVIGIDKNGHTFAYLAWGKLLSSLKPNAPGVGAYMNVVFYDVHGTGHFDTVQVGVLKRLPFVPDWVK